MRRASAIMMCARSWHTPARAFSASSIGESTCVVARRVCELMKQRVVQPPQQRQRVGIAAPVDLAGQRQRAAASRARNG